MLDLCATPIIYTFGNAAVLGVACVMLYFFNDVMFCSLQDTGGIN